MSGYTADVISHHGVSGEEEYFIQKPFSINDLAAKLQEILSNDKRNSTSAFDLESV
jgi:DNA-binding response OmpR family regulator